MPRRAPSILTEEYLRERYLTLGLTAEQIAVRAGCGKGLVQNYLKKFGIRKTDEETYSKQYKRFDRRIKARKIGK